MSSNELLEFIFNMSIQANKNIFTLHEIYNKVKKATFINSIERFFNLLEPLFINDNIELLKNVGGNLGFKIGFSVYDGLKLKKVSFLELLNLDETLDLEAVEAKIKLIEDIEKYFIFPSLKSEISESEIIKKSLLHEIKDNLEKFFLLSKQWNLLLLRER